MKTKKFVNIFIFIFITFIAYHLLIWFFITSKIFNLPKNYIVGDLGRMSYQVNCLVLRKTHVDLNVSHYYKQNFKNQKIDIVTLGDSFFNGGGGGRNPYLQDYLVKYTHKKILNIINNNPQQSPIALIENLIDIGWFDKYKPKYLILESVQRAMDTFNKEKKIPLTDLDTINNSILSPGQSLFTYVPKIKIINTANYKSLYYTIAYNFSNNAKKDVYKFHLKRKMFKKGNKVILIHKDDLHKIDFFTAKKLLKINKKLNDISIKLQKKGISLIVLIATNKYNLYSDYIEEQNNFPKDLFFKKFEQLPKKYIYINTKEILYPYLTKEKDIFYLDDTHWSYKANSIISKYIEKQGILK